MAQLNSDPVSNEDLENWLWVASGGFGDVYRARHKKLGFDVAIKLPREDTDLIVPPEEALCNEANHMKEVSSDFVSWIYGIYEGCPPIQGRSRHTLGLVTKFMRKGSIESLQSNFPGSLPWPLVFRLAHEVALGMNILHSKRLVHGDLKPSNVLLDDDLRVKLSDFGLSGRTTSQNTLGQVTRKETGGSYKYMPPEAFHVLYAPCRSFDVYSYGILLWSIITGKEPYPGKDFAHVMHLIPRGNEQRPPVNELLQKSVLGMKEIIKLMQLCWDADPFKRPAFLECSEVTEDVFSRHRDGIYGAVNEVLTKLESNSSEAVKYPASTPEKSSDSVKHSAQTPQMPVRTQPSTKTLTEEDKEKFVDDNSAVLIQDTDMVMAITEELQKMVHKEAYSRISAQGTSQDKMRELYRGPLRSGGRRVKAAFYDALTKHQSDLVERLSG